MTAPSLNDTPTTVVSDVSSEICSHPCSQATDNSKSSIAGVLDSESQSNSLDSSAEKSLDSLCLQESTNTKPLDSRDVKWRKQPTHMLLFASCGLLLAIGHHVCYNALHGKLATNSKQQCAHNMGNMFAVIIVAVLHTAKGRAYNQYLWLTVRHKAFSLATLDRLFSLTSDPSSFLSIELWTQAPMAVFLALACWSMALAGVLPPGTITVVPGLVKEKANVSLPTLDWTSSSWVQDALWQNMSAGTVWTTPMASVITQANQAAASLNIVSFDPPASNSSYKISVRGPYIQCEPANSTQLPIFDLYNDNMAQAGLYSAITERLIPNSMNVSSSSDMLFYSAFDLTLFSNWQPDREALYDTSSGPDTYNNWDMPLPSNFLNDYGFFAHSPQSSDSSNNWTAQMVPRQLFVQTSEKSIVCTLGNGTREVTFSFNDGAQTITYSQIQDFEPLFVPLRGGPDEKASENGHLDSDTNMEIYPYVAIYVSLTNMLAGNVTAFMGVQGTLEEWSIVDGSSRILDTGLDACDDFTQSPFNLHPYYFNVTNINTTNLNSIMPIDRFNGTYHGGFKKPSWMCRNSTLERAIEDLATNITISMMASPDFTTPNSTTVEVTFLPTRNVYHYSPLYLFTSYGLALLFTTISVALGFYAFHSNGAIHSTSFSSIIATTRNPDLDDISRGNSLGALPHDENARGVRLRFGVLMGEGVEHAAFGREEGVGTLRRGGVYV